MVVKKKIFKVMEGQFDFMGGFEDDGVVVKVKFVKMVKKIVVKVVKKVFVVKKKGCKLMVKLFECQVKKFDNIKVKVVCVFKKFDIEDKFLYFVQKVMEFVLCDVDLFVDVLSWMLFNVLYFMKKCIIEMGDVMQWCSFFNLVQVCKFMQIFVIV